MISIVIPTYNEKENIVKLTKQIFDLKINGLEIIVVDDNSPDGSGFLVDQLTKKYPLTAIHRKNKGGLGSAYRLGFKIALEKKADLIFQIDADFSHNPKEIPIFIKEAMKGTEMIIGSRRVDGGKIIGWNYWRHCCSFMASQLARLVLNLKTKDITSGYRCYQRHALEKINPEKIKSDGYSFFEEITYLAEKHHLKIKEIPIIFVDRQAGKSKLGYKEIIEFFKTILRLFLKNIKLIDLEKCEEKKKK